MCRWQALCVWWCGRWGGDVHHEPVFALEPVRMRFQGGESTTQTHSLAGAHSGLALGGCKNVKCQSGALEVPLVSHVTCLGQAAA